MSPLWHGCGAQGGGHSHGRCCAGGPERTSHSSCGPGGSGSEVQPGPALPPRRTVRLTSSRGPVLTRCALPPDTGSAGQSTLASEVARHRDSLFLAREAGNRPPCHIRATACFLVVPAQQHSKQACFHQGELPPGHTPARQSLQPLQPRPELAPSTLLLWSATSCARAGVRRALSGALRTGLSSLLLHPPQVWGAAAPAHRERLLGLTASKVQGAALRGLIQGGQWVGVRLPQEQSPQQTISSPPGHAPTPGPPFTAASGDLSAHLSSSRADPFPPSLLRMCAQGPLPKPLPGRRTTTGCVPPVGRRRMQPPPSPEVRTCLASFLSVGHHPAGREKGPRLCPEDPGCQGTSRLACVCLPTSLRPLA